MQVCRTEVFGPVVGVAAYDTFDEAVALANDTRYGLQAGVFTSNMATALSAADRLDFGGVLINEVPTWRADQQPYGGVRDSRQHPGGPALRGAGDDRAPHDRHPGVERPAVGPQLTEGSSG